MPIGRNGTSQSTIGWSRTHARFGFGLAIDSGNLRSNSPSDDNPPLLNSGFDYGLRIDDRSFRQDVGWVVGAHAIDVGLRRTRTDHADALRVHGRSAIPSRPTARASRVGRACPTSCCRRRQPHAAAHGSRTHGMRVRTSPSRPVCGWTDRQSRDATTVSPRATASWVGGHDTTVTAATGLYTQSPGYEKLSNSDYMLDLTHPEADRLSSEHAWLTSVAVEQRLPRGFTLKAEAYLTAARRPPHRAARTGARAPHTSVAVRLSIRTPVTTCPQHPPSPWCQRTAAPVAPTDST